MPRLVNTLLKPVVQYNALSWLKKNDYSQPVKRKLENYINRASKTNIGKKLGVQSNSKIDEIDFTHYPFYQPFFENPKQGDLLYRLEDYVRAITSGTMGKPKSFLLPKTGLWESLRKSGMTFMFLCTHDGEKITYELEDTVYQNMPGGQFISSFYHELINENIHGGWVNQVPDVNLSFQRKIDYFIENYENIDVAYMTVTSLFDQIQPKIEEGVKLKGFITQDRSAFTLKDKIKEYTGAYPKTVYGSTETMFGALPSIEYPGGFFFDWRVLYTEFIPEDKVLEHSDLTSEHSDIASKMDELEEGKRYQLVATPFGNDLIRFVMPDILECIAQGDTILGTRIPVFRYYSRSDNLLVLHNFTRINEDEIDQVLKSAGIDCVDFVAVRELIDTREYLKLYIELREEIDVDSLSRLLDEKLTSFDKDWSDFKEMLGYNPLIVEVLPKGSFNRYLQQKPGVPKIARINMAKQNLELLLS